MPRKKQPASPLAWRGQDFHQLHTEQAALHGTGWLAMNMLFVDTASALGHEPYTPVMRLLLTALATRALERPQDRALADAFDAALVGIAPLTLTVTDRGFVIGAWLDRYGKACRIQGSSLATEACIWLGAGDQAMHLTRGMVAALLPLLARFVATGELTGGAPLAPAATGGEDAR